MLFLKRRGNPLPPATFLLRCDASTKLFKAAVTAATPKGYHLSMTVCGYHASGSDERPGQSTPKPQSVAHAALRYSGGHASHITETKASASKEQDHRRGKLLTGIGWP